MLKKKQTFFVILISAITALLTYDNYQFYLAEQEPDLVTVQIDSTLPEVSASLETQFKRLINILEGEGIEIDWSGVDKIFSAPLATGLHGLYISKTNVVIVNTGISLPTELLFTRTFRQTYDDFVLCIIAHEVLHSLRIEHTSDSLSLMYRSDLKTLEQIKELGPEEYILQAYRCIEELQRDYPSLYK